MKSNNAVRFKCLASGNIFEFTNEHDIKTTRAHPGYEEVKEEETLQIVGTYEEISTVRKPLGRPKKEQ